MTTPKPPLTREAIEKALHVDWAFNEKHGEIARDLNGNKPDRIIVQGYPRGAYHTSYEYFVNNMLALFEEAEKAHKRELLEARLEAYRNCKNWEGTANSIRSYAIMQIQEIKAQLKQLEEE